MKKEIRFYCVYCKEPIYYGKSYTKDEDNKVYHPKCYELISTYTDDSGIYTTDEFGDTDEIR